MSVLCNPINAQPSFIVVTTNITCHYCNYYLMEANNKGWNHDAAILMIKALVFISVNQDNWTVLQIMGSIVATI